MTVDQFLDRIDDAIAAGEWQTAKDLCEQALTINPDAAEVLIQQHTIERQLEKAGRSPEGAQRLPDSFVDGRYRVRALLGEGSRKKVYLARDTQLDRNVAFAIIKENHLERAARQHLLREVKTLAQLGSHPNIISVIDIGEEPDGQPYLILEYMPEGALSAVLGTEGPLPLADVVRIAGDVCRGLDFIHRNGVIHRDIKTDNVWLGVDGSVKIGHIGLSFAHGRTRLTAAGTIIGTAAYLAPEHATGGPLTPRTDLYSLGCTLYELLTGEPPFRADDDIALVAQHIHGQPVAPSWHRPDCPPGLDRVVLALLRKDPDRRPATAVEVARLLAAAAQERQPAGAMGMSRSRTIDSLADGTFVGRRDEVQRMHAALEETVAGRGSLVTVVGEPGIGKTRLVTEVATYAVMRDMEVVWGRAIDDEASPAYWPWVQGLNRLVDATEPAQLRGQLVPDAGVLTTMLPRLRQRIPDIEAAPAMSAPEAARYRLYEAVVHFLRRRSAEQPLMFVLDDLHWADASSLRLLEYVARELAGAAVLLVGIYRDVQLSRTHPLQRTLAELSRAQLATRVLLRGLSEPEVHRYVQLAAGIAVPPRLAQAVFTHTQGNPLFATEVVRLLVEDGELDIQRLQETRRWTIGVPEGLRQVIGRRIDHLPRECQHPLTVAALLGEHFTLQQLGAVVDQTESELVDIIDTLLAARIIGEQQSALDSFQFTHGLVRQVLLEEVSVTRRARMHAEIAQALERLYGATCDDHAEELVLHLGNAETVLGADKLLHYCVVAGERALEQHGFEQAVRYFERALAVERPESDELSARINFGYVRSAIPAYGRHFADAAVELAARVSRAIATAYDVFERLGCTSQLLAVASYAFQIGDDVPPIFERALAHAEPGSRAEGRILWNQLVSSRSYATGEEISDLERRIASAAAVAGDRDLQARMLALRGQMRYVNPIPAEAFDAELSACLQDSQEALSMIDDSCDHTTIYTAYRAHFGGLWNTGRTAEARETLDQFEAVARRTGMSLAGVHSKRAEIFFACGEWHLLRQAHATVDADFREERVYDGLRTPGTAILMEAELGNRDAALQLLTDLEREVSQARPRSLLLGQGTLTLMYAVVGRMLGDRDLLSRIHPVASHVVQHGHWVGVSGALRALGMAAAELGQVDQGSSAYQQISAQRRSLHIISLKDERILGMIATALGDYDAAIAHLDSAAEFYARAGWRPGYAWICCDQADALIARGAKGDPERADARLQECLQLTDELEMRTLAARVAERRAALDGRVKASYPSGLTEREVEVLRLLSRGKTDKEMADALFIAHSTASNHVRNILAKTGCNNRAEAVAYASRHGLVGAQL